MGNKNYKNRHTTQEHGRTMMIKSPCIRHCNINIDNFCSGCGRERQEIQQWARCNDEQKTSILKISKERLNKTLDKDDT